MVWTLNFFVFDEKTYLISQIFLFKRGKPKYHNFFRIFIGALCRKFSNSDCLTLQCKAIGISIILQLMKNCWSVALVEPVCVQ